jgi:L-fuconolactonase
VIDAHQHFWRIERGDYGWLTQADTRLRRDFAPAELEPALRQRGVSSTILVQAAPTVAETHYLLDLARNWPLAAGVVGWCALDDVDAPAQIERMVGESLLVGLRAMIHDIDDLDWMLRHSVLAALAAMARHDLVFDALVQPMHLSRLLRVADALPQLRIIIDHAAKPDIAAGAVEPWRSLMAELARRPNVHVKLSGLITEAREDWSVEHLQPYVQRVLEIFGAARVIWGSDWPVLNLRGDYGRWCDATDALIAGLSVAERSAVLGTNASAMYLHTRGRRVAC